MRRRRVSKLGGGGAAGRKIDWSWRDEYLLSSFSNYSAAATAEPLGWGWHASIIQR